MDKQLKNGAQLKLEVVEASELANVSGGVKGTYDESGKLIRTCTGPFMPIKTVSGIGTVRLG